MGFFDRFRKSQEVENKLKLEVTTQKNLGENTSDPSIAAKEWSCKGFFLDASGQLEEAIIAYDHAIALKPDLTEAWINKGSSLAALGRHREAIAVNDHVISFNPDLAEAWGNKGFSLTALGLHEQAIGAYDRAIALKPDLVDAWNNKGRSLNKLGRYVEAVAAYDRAITLQPDYDEVWYNKGCSLYSLGRFNEAVAVYDRAIAMKPDYLDALCNKGASLDALGRYNDAVTTYDSIISLKPDFVDVWCNKGSALENLGKIEEAIKCYQRFIELAPPEYSSDVDKIKQKMNNLNEKANAPFNQSKQLDFDRLKANKDVDGLIKSLEYPDMSYYRRGYNREKAAAALGEIGDGRAVESLVSLLRAKEPLVCKAAVESLGKIRSVHVIESLIKDFQYGDITTRKYVEIAFLNQGLGDNLDTNMRQEILNLRQEIIGGHIEKFKKLMQKRLDYKGRSEAILNKIVNRSDIYTLKAEEKQILSDSFISLGDFVDSLENLIDLGLQISDQIGSEILQSQGEIKKELEMVSKNLGRNIYESSPSFEKETEKAVSDKYKPLPIEYKKLLIEMQVYQLEKGVPLYEDKSKENLGKYLFRHGGMYCMVRFAYAFQSIGGNMERNLTYFWDGIGGWMV